MGPLNPLNIFLRQEIDRMQKVIVIVRKTLKDLLLAIEGTIIMSEVLRDALDSIYDALVPSFWAKTSWSSSTLGFWFTELLERNDQFRNWCFVVKPPSFWMTGFFNPQGSTNRSRWFLPFDHPFRTCLQVSWRQWGRKLRGPTKVGPLTSAPYTTKWRRTTEMKLRQARRRVCISTGCTWTEPDGIEGIPVWENPSIKFYTLSCQLYIFRP